MDSGRASFSRSPADLHRALERTDKPWAAPASHAAGVSASSQSPMRSGLSASGAQTGAARTGARSPSIRLPSVTNSDADSDDELGGVSARGGGFLTSAAGNTGATGTIQERVQSRHASSARELDRPESAISRAPSQARAAEPRPATAGPRAQHDFAHEALERPAPPAPRNAAEPPALSLRRLPVYQGCFWDTPRNSWHFFEEDVEAKMVVTERLERRRRHLGIRAPPPH